MLAPKFPNFGEPQRIDLPQNLKQGDENGCKPTIGCFWKPVASTYQSRSQIRKRRGKKPADVLRYVHYRADIQK